MRSILLDEAVSAGQSSIMLIVWLAIFFVIMYFMMIRPQKNEQKKKQMMLNEVAIGDTVLTTSGFYGTIIAIQGDTVIVEFGSNKTCRIPMQREAIAAIEKPEDASKVQAEPEKKAKKAKKEETK